MEIIRLDLNNLLPIANRLSLCLGYFDGLHLGHQKVIKEAIDDSIGPVAVVTFSRAPGFVSKKHKQEMVLMSNEMKAEVLAKMGVSYLLVLDADEKFIKMTADQFIFKILMKLKPIKLYCGPDYRFGYLRIGDTNLLKKYFKVSVIDELKNGDEKISSTKIIRYLQGGDLMMANRLLGRDYTIEGTIVEGSHIGTKLGYPTANIESTIPYCVPKTGVYFTKINIDGETFYALTNVGGRPTVHDDKKVVVEAHIPNFNGDLYGKNVSLSFISYIRDEQKFASRDELKEQISRDLKVFNELVLERQK